MFMSMFRTQTKGEYISEDKQEFIKRDFSSILLDTLASQDTPRVMTIQHTWNIIQDELMKMLNDLFGIELNANQNLNIDKSNAKIKFRFLSNVDEKNESLESKAKRTSIFLISDYTNFTILNVLYLFNPITKFVEECSELIQTKETQKLVEFIHQNIKERLIPKLKNDYKNQLEEMLSKPEAFQPNLNHQRFKTTDEYEFADAQPILLVI
jgi:flagellin-specific chaperone FliS